MRYDLTDLSRLALPHPDIGYAMALAWEAASDPLSEIADCPFGPSRHTCIRHLRIAWRTAFRCARQRKRLLAVQNIAKTGLRIAA